jgi:hypothetical protein
MPWPTLAPPEGPPLAVFRDRCLAPRMLWVRANLAMSSPLRPCPTCARHARVTEAACPFCGHALGAAFRATPSPREPARRLTRAALLAFGSGTSVLAPSCSSSSSNNNTSFIAPYGAPPIPDASLSVDSGDPSSCVNSGGQCSAEGQTCAFSIPASCDESGGGSCCVPCQADPDVKAISVANYDRACTVDADCVAVGVGDPCQPCDILCPGNAAINASSLSQYRLDVAASPALGDGATCVCAPTTLSVCCNAGTCDPSCGADGSGGAIAPVDAGLDDAEVYDAEPEDADLDDADTGVGDGSPD